MLAPGGCKGSKRNDLCRAAQNALKACIINLRDKLFSGLLVLETCLMKPFHALLTNAAAVMRVFGKLSR